jgi:hypothetical protein
VLEYGKRTDFNRFRKGFCLLFSVKFTNQKKGLLLCNRPFKNEVLTLNNNANTLTKLVEHFNADALVFVFFV